MKQKTISLLLALALALLTLGQAEELHTYRESGLRLLGAALHAFTTPDVVLYMAAAKNAATAAGTTDTVAPTAYDLDAVATQLAAASQAPGAREMLQSQLTDGLAQLDETVADSLSSQAMLLVALEYDAQGIAHDVCCARAARCWL